MGPMRATAAVPVERRESERARTQCPAQLHLTTGVRFGQLWDLSETGARVELEDPPRRGTEALLKWQSHEALGRVVWAQDDMCGVMFFKPLPRTMLDETLREEARPVGPAASVTNIPLGQKRSRL
jgi:hypothetical protein